jgi:hypothetical protein
MEIRFYLDPETSVPHIYQHGVSEEEVRQVFMRRGDDFRGGGRSWIRFGQTSAGRYLKVIYVPDEIGDGMFVITAYDLRNKARRAFRRRQRRKRR